MLLYHAGMPWARGALLSMDVFFALSGFLITSLLVSEWRRRGAVSLKAFWARRARRLVPGLVVVLLGIAAFIAFVTPVTERASVRGDALATIGYAANWRFVFAGKGYFDQFADPSPLLHMWSLAVEEQFYLVWPLVAVAVFVVSRRRAGAYGRSRGTRNLALVAAVGAVASAGLMAWLSFRGAEPSRLYYGTDTRAQALLVGAALAAARPAAAWGLGRRAGAALQAVGFAAAGLIVFWWHVVDGQSDWLYRGGFFAVAVGVVVVIAAVVEMPSGPLAGLLSFPPLRYVGQISYGLYLWHWPVFLYLTHARTGLTGTALLMLRLVTTVAIAAASYHFVEDPIRRKRLRLPRPAVAMPATAMSVAGILVVATTGPAAPNVSGLDERTGQLVAAAPTATGGPGRPGVARPVRVLVAGDSVALTLGRVLAPDAPRHDVSLFNAGLVGCGLARGGPVRHDGEESDPLARCEGWPALRAEEVSRFDPDVAVQLVGRWDVLDRMHDGYWTHVGEPGYDDYLRSEMNRSVDVLSARGAKVILLTAPCFGPRERPDGGIWPENDPARVDAFNQIVRDVAAGRPDVVRVIDFEAMVCPGGQYVAGIDGVPLRYDGIHIDPAAGPYLTPRLLPDIVRVGEERTNGG